MADFLIKAGADIELGASTPLMEAAQEGHLELVKYEFVLIQWALHTIESWCGELGLSVNPDKTGLVAFTRKRKLPGFFEPRLFGKTLQCSVLVKYLESDPGFTSDLEGTRGC